jgi:hypothetical protein
LKNTTDSLGNASYYFNPDCSYSVGQQYWIAGTTDSCYQDLNTSNNYSTYVYGDLRLLITSPKGEKYLLGENNTLLRGNITDSECSNTINYAIVNFTAVQSGQERTCSSVSNEGDGWYNCTITNTTHASWTPSTYPSTGYSVKLNATTANYNYNSTSENYQSSVSGFFLETRANLTNPNATASGNGGWGELWTFRINATDRDSDRMVVRLYLRRCTDSSCTAFGPSPYDAWYLENSNNSVYGTNTTVAFTKNNFEAGHVGKWQMKFNVYDYNNAGEAWDVNETTPVNFTLDKDDINVTYIAGNNSIVNRSITPGQTILSIRIYDTDKNVPLAGSIPGKGKIYVTTNPSNPSNFTEEFSLDNTMPDGYINHTTFPDSSHRCWYDIGPLRWRAEFGSTSLAYKTVNSSDFYLNTTTYPLQTNILAPNNQTRRAGVDPISYVGNVTDDCSETLGRGVINSSITFVGYIVTSYYWSSCSGSSVTDNNNGTYNCTVNSPSDAILDYYNLNMSATKNYYIDSETKIKDDAFVLVTNPRIGDQTVNPSTEGWGRDYTFTVYVGDTDKGTYGFEKMNVSLWLNLTGQWQLANSTICDGAACSGYTPKTFVQRFSCGDQGTHQYKFNVSDYWNYTNTTSGTDTFTIGKDTVSIPPGDLIYPSNINRESGSGLFVFRIYDSDKGEYVTNISTNAAIYFGYDENVNAYNISFSASPNSTGYANYSLNPDCNYSTGKHYWTAGTINDACYDSSNISVGLESTFNVTGQLKNSLTLPVYDSAYNVTKPVPINFTTLSDCSANRTDENPVINATDHKIELSLIGSGWESCSAQNSYNGWYNCTWNSTAKQEGRWDIRVNSTKPGYFYSNSTVYTDWFQLVNWNVSNTSIPTVSPSQGGWTRKYNYTVSIYDQEGDTINCSLYVSKDNQNIWEYKGSSIVTGTPGTPTQGICWIAVHDFSCTDIDLGSNQKWFKWHMENGEPTNAWNTTPIQGPILNESNVTVSLVEGNDYAFNRSSGNNLVRRFAVNVYDSENSTYANNANVSFYVTNDSSNYRFDLKNASDNLGNASYYFNPDCTYSVGQQTWIAGTTDSCYQDLNTSSNYSTYVYGDLRLLITSPKGEKYLRGNYPDGVNISFIGNITDSECNQPITDAFVNFSAIKSITQYCNPFVNIGGGQYNCSLNTTGFSAQGWDVTFNASRVYYNSNSTTDTFQIWQKGFWVETKPVLTTDFVYYTTDYLGNVGDGGWGETWKFRVNATDEDGDTLYIRFWINSTSSDAWIPKGSNNSMNGTNILVNITLSPALGLTEAMLSRKFKFNVSEYKDIFGNTTTDFAQNINETANGTFTPQKDDINITHIEGNDTTVNRSIGTQHLKVRVWDTDKGEYASLTSNPTPAARIWVTTNGSNTFVVITQSPAQITSGGFINTTGSGFDPTCTPTRYEVGPQKWKAGTTDDNPYYKAKNSSDFNIAIVTQPLVYVIKEPLNGEKFIKNYPELIDNIPIKTNVSDDCGLLAGADVTIIAQRGSTIKDCSSILGSGDYNCTFLNTTIGNDPSWNYGYWNVSTNATKDYYNSSPTLTEVNAFYISSKPELSLPTLVPYIDTTYDTYDWGDIWLFNINVEDKDSGGEQGSYVNVSFWINTSVGETYYGSKICVRGVNCTDEDPYGPVNFSSIEFVCNRTYSDIGSRSFKFNATDNFGYTDEITQDFSIDKDHTYIEDAYSNASSMAREGNEYVRMASKFGDSRKGAISFADVNGSVSISKNDTFDFNQFLQTNSSGYFNYDFNATCDFIAGKRWWKIALNDSCYEITQTANQSLDIIGQLKNSIIYPIQSSNIVVGDTINVTSNISTECGEIIGDATVNHEKRKPNLVYEIIPPSPAQILGNGFYNSSWNTSFHTGGYYGIRVNSSKTYYYNNSTLFTSWVYLNNTEANYSNPNVSPSQEGWGVTFNYSIVVNDTQIDNVTCTLFVTTNGTWNSKGNVTVVNGVGLCSINVSDFTCSDKGDDNYFIWQLNDGTNVRNTTTIAGPNITEDDVIIYYVSGDNTKVNRSDNAYNNVDLLILGVNDTDKNIKANNATVTFYVTKDGNIFRTETNTTNSSGIVNYYFNPDCNYNQGQQKWKGSVTDICYVQQNTTNYTLEIYGDFNYSPTSYRSPNVYSDQIILRTEQNVTMNAGTPPTNEEIKDDCISPIDADNVTMQAINNATGDVYNCTQISSPSTGVYRCNRNTSDMRARWYDLVVNATKDYFNNKSIRVNGSFFIETKPVLANISVNSTQGGETGGWGERFYFNVTVTDEDYDFVNVTLYTRKYGTSSWINANKTDIDSPVINKTITLSWVRGTCGASQSDPYPHVWEFKFNATDDPNSPIVTGEDPYETSIEPKNFSMEKDDTNLTFMSGSGDVWRNGTDYKNLSLKVTDTDINAVVAAGVNGSFWVTTNGTNFAGQKISETEPNGNLTYKFPQDLPAGQNKCDYKTGTQKWFGGVYNDGCYKDKNTTVNYTINLWSLLLPTVVYPSGQGYIRGDLVPVNGSLSDECTFVEGATVTYTYIPELGLTYQCTIADNNGWLEGQGWYNCTKSTFGKPRGWYNVSISASKNYYASNSTIKPNTFYLGERPELSDPKVVIPDTDTPKTRGGWGELYEFRVTFKDADLNWNNLSLWKSYDNVTWQLIEMKSIQGNGIPVSFYHRLGCNDYALQSPYFYFKFNTTDPFGYTAETVSNNMTLERDNVTLSISSSSNSSVRRIRDNIAFLEFRIYDSDNQTYPTNANGTIYLTENNVNYTSAFNCTSSNGYCSINYNPNCTSSVGMQYWIGGTIEKSGFSCYQILNSTVSNFTVYGQLNISLNSPLSGKVLNRDKITDLN